MTNGRTTEIFFIVDGARLEAQACVLAPSLKEHLLPDQKAVAYVREDYLDNLEPITREVLTASDIEIRTIPGTNSGHAPWLSPYPAGNKILAAAAARDCDISVFLDTDMVLVDRVDFQAELGDALIASCVSDYAASAGSDEDWAAYYAAFGMLPPKDRVQYNGGRKLVSFPYYNAGMIVFRERTDDGVPTGIGAEWLQIALKFEDTVQREYLRANIDQFTLPILGYLREAPVKSLPQHMNFNIQAFGEGEGQRQSIVHYHRIGILWANQTHGRRALDRLIELRGPDAAEEFLDAFGVNAKRKRMKPHLQAIKEELAQSAVAPAVPAGAGANPKKKRLHHART